MLVLATIIKLRHSSSSREMNLKVMISSQSSYPVEIKLCALITCMDIMTQNNAVSKDGFLLLREITDIYLAKQILCPSPPPSTPTPK